MKKWKCTVCGYIHEGEEPPEKCPICKADKSKFIEVVENQEEPSKISPKATQKHADTTKQPSKYNGFISKQITKHHIHPITVHIPNGVIPISFAFIILGIIFSFNTFIQVAIYNLVFVIISIPLVLHAGYVEWLHKYNGIMTKYFRIKIICGIVVSISIIITLIWYFLSPNIIQAASSAKLIFIIINLITLISAGIAGFIGGKLVFKE